MENNYTCCLSLVTTKHLQSPSPVPHLARSHNTFLSNYIDQVYFPYLHIMWKKQTVSISDI